VRGTNSRHTLGENTSTLIDPNHPRHVQRTGVPRRPGAGWASVSGGEMTESESSPGETAEWSGSSKVLTTIADES